jgi:hypothetical protein
MRSEIVMRPQPQPAEPVELNWRTIVALCNEPDFVAVSSLIALGFAAPLWLAVKLPLPDMMAALIGHVGYYP